jgi:hypothetical protein
MSTTLIEKIERLYEAVKESRDTDLANYPPIYEMRGAMVTVTQDFNRGMKSPKLLNVAFEMIRSIADLKDYLRGAARRAGRDPEEVEKVIDGCLSLQLLIDLANLDKHGKHDKPSKQRSGMSPRLDNVRGALRMQTGGAAGAFIGIQLTPQGAVPFGDGNAAVIITGDIVDDTGNITALDYTQDQSVAAWEDLFAKFGIALKPASP